MKNIFSFALSASLFLTTLPLAACTSPTASLTGNNKNVLRVASWDEYIDEGGEDSYVEGSQALYEEFEIWYKETTGKDIEVEYITLQDNETMYNKIKMGDTYDLLCPSEYMIMKLASENYIQKYPDSFFDEKQEHNYYAKYVSPYIKKVFNDGKLNNGSSWGEYAAGYMWGTTGFIFNPENIDRTTMSSWNSLLSPACKRQITVKDNVRDTYFVGLGMYHEEKLLSLKQEYENGGSLESYQTQLKALMNDTSPETIEQVKKKLEAMRSNLYGIETDEAKFEMIMGRLDASFQWSGDAVYILDEAESYSEENPLILEYCIPEASSNLWFDGWVLMKDSKNVEAATAFVNFLSMPQNAVRNMYYIGYTSCIGGEEVFDYITETYSADESETESIPYDLSYFFGENAILNTSVEQTRRQLFAQYPDEKTIARLVVMHYFDKETNQTLNRMWNTIK